MATASEPKSRQAPSSTRSRSPRTKALEALIADLLATPLTDRRDSLTYGDIPELATWIKANAHRLRFE